MTTIAISNQKGGVGKTTTAWMLGRHLRQAGRRVLVIDLDPQSNLTRLSGITPNGHNVSDVLGGAVTPTANLRSASRTGAHDLDIVPSKLDDLENAASALTMHQLDPRANMKRPAIKALQRAIDAEKHRWDFILIDCPPSAGMLTVNALCAADRVLIPSIPEDLSIDGVDQMIGVLRDVADALGRTIPHTVIATLADERTVGHRHGLDLLRRKHAVEFVIPARRGLDADAQLFAAYAPLAQSLLEE